MEKEKDNKAKQPPDAPLGDAPIGKSHGDGTELARDKQRTDGGPRYGGGSWELAEERGDQRFGHARNDDADPSELSAAEQDVDDSPDPADPPLADVELDQPIETGGERAGMGRGEKPRKPASREKK